MVGKKREMTGSQKKSILFLALICLLVWVYISLYYQKRDLDENAAYADATIMKYGYDHNLNQYSIRYEYEVDGNKYENSEGTQVKLNCGKWCKGFVYRVQYSTINPENSKILLQYPVDTIPHNPWGGNYTEDLNLKIDTTSNLIGDYLFIEKDRIDTLGSPSLNSKQFIKRQVASEGDSVSVVEGVLKVNGIGPED